MCSSAKHHWIWCAWLVPGTDQVPAGELSTQFLGMKLSLRYIDSATTSHCCAATFTQHNMAGALDEMTLAWVCWLHRQDIRARRYQCAKLNPPSIVPSHPFRCNLVPHHVALDEITTALGAPPVLRHQNRAPLCFR